MSTFLWIMLVVLYLTALVVLGMATLRTLMSPTPQAAAGHESRTA